MSDDRFEADWLTLREPVDHRSRPERLATRLAEAADAFGWSRAVDLGSGRGSNLRWLAPHLPAVTEWVAVDHDAALLRALEPPEHATLELAVGDLGDAGLTAVAESDIVTASALLDLVSAEWVASLARTLAGRQVGVLFSLSYDGTSGWAAGDADDAFVLDAVNRHQRREKGMGAALGPDATGVTADALRGAGFTVEVAESPWILSGQEDAPLALKLIRGWHGAALEIEPEASARLADWLASRSERIHAGDFEVTVGHLDLLALPGE